VKLEDKDVTLLLHDTLPKIYEYFKDTLFSMKEVIITLKEVQTSIRTKDLQKFQESNKREDNELSLDVSKSKENNRKGI